MRTMSKKEVDLMFYEDYMPSIRKIEREQAEGRRARKDKPLRRMTYNDMVDCLFRDGSIDYNQAATYCIPKRLV